jgi:hypothetical protein
MIALSLALSIFTELVAAHLGTFVLEPGSRLGAPFSLGPHATEVVDSGFKFGRSSNLKPGPLWQPPR